MRATINPTVTLSYNGTVFISMLDFRSNVPVKYQAIESDRIEFIEMIWGALASLAPKRDLDAWDQLSEVWEDASGHKLIVRGHHSNLRFIPVVEAEVEKLAATLRQAQADRELLNKLREILTLGGASFLKVMDFQRLLEEE